MPAKVPDQAPPFGFWFPQGGEVLAILAPSEPQGPHLQKLWVFLAQLLKQGRQQRWVLLNHLPHILELGLVPQELQGVLSGWQEGGM